MPAVISVADVEKGMVLANPLINRYGQVLISKGTALESRHLKLLKTWGIKFINIIGDDIEENIEDEMDEAIQKQLESKMFQRMMWRPRNDFEEDMLKVAIKRHYRKLKSEEG